MINFIKELLGYKRKTPQLYAYYMSFTVINDKNKIVEFIEFDRKFSQNEKVAFRRILKRLNPNCTIKQKGGYRTYVR